MLGTCHQGSVILGLGFTMPQEEAQLPIAQYPRYEGHVAVPISRRQGPLTLNSIIQPERWVICFWDWSEQKAGEYTPL